MRPLRSLPWLLLAPVLVAQGAKPAPQKAASPKKVHAVKGPNAQAIAEEANARFSKAMESGDPAAVAALYTEGAELQMSPKDVYKGREAIQKFVEGFLKATPVKSAKVVSTAAHRQGKTVTDAGTWTFIVDDKGKTSTMSGKYVQLLWHDKDGQWRLNLDHPVFDAPAK